VKQVIRAAVALNTSTRRSLGALSEEFKDR
jgi:hypothetical protein